MINQIPNNKSLIVITGASSGIGEATARKLSEEGYPLLLLARRVDRLNAMNLSNTMCRKVDVVNLQDFQNAIIGLLNGIHAVISKMKQRNKGTIINVSSIAGRKTFPNHAVYCGTKFAVHAMTENIREEVASYNIRCITIAPGAVETELLGHTTNESIKQGYEDWKQDMGGVLSAIDVANAISYAYNQPQNVCIREIVLAATGQSA